MWRARRACEEDGRVEASGEANGRLENFASDPRQGLHERTCRADSLSEVLGFEIRVSEPFDNGESCRRQELFGGGGREIAEVGRPGPHLVELTKDARSADAAQDRRGAVEETRDGHLDDDDLELFSARAHDAPKAGLELFGREMFENVEKADDARAEGESRQNLGADRVLREKKSFDAGVLQAFHGDPRCVQAGDGREARGPAGFQEPSPPGAVVDDAGEARDVTAKELDEASGLPDSRRPKGFEEGALFVLAVVVEAGASCPFVEGDSMAAGATPGDGEAGGRNRSAEAPAIADRTAPERSGTLAALRLGHGARQ